MKKGELLGKRYEIIEKIGEGGMGTVYKAKDNYLGDVIALKILLSSLGDQGVDALERFKREAKAGMRITHENVIRIHDIGEHEGVTYISMEYVAGEDLKCIIREKGAIPRERALIITKQICKALQASHNKGIIHKDVKPQNILIEEGSNQVKVVDFGLARAADMMQVTATGLLVGTPYYISPQQAMGMDIDHRSDIYSLGVVLFEMFTGKLPFTADTPLAVCNKHLHEKPPNPASINTNVTADICRIILKCLEKDPSLRYQDCGEILFDIRHCMIMAESKLSVGSCLGTRFEIVDILGRGGMGIVYKAIDRNFNDLVVALKVLPEEVVRDAGIPDSRESSSSQSTSLVREAAAAARLNHPNIVRVFNMDEIAGKHYISMEYLEGQNLAQILRKKGKFSLCEAVKYVLQICDALGYAHSNHVIHRDLKPSNFVLTTEDNVKITDFGIAQIAESATMTAKTSTSGTLAYMSPQQLQGLTIDNRSDIYSLGIVFYEFLSGRPPFISGDTTYQHINISPKSPGQVIKGIPEEIDAIVMKCIQKNPDDRYKTCEELLTSLLNYARMSEINELHEISSAFQLPVVSQPRKKLFTRLVIGVSILIVTASSIFFVFRYRDGTEVITELTMQARELFEGHNYRDAKEKWDEVLALDPEYSEAIAGIKKIKNKLEAEQLHKEAKQLFQTRDLTDEKTAMEKWRKALELDPTHTEAISEYQSAVTINSLRDKIDRSIKRAQALFMDKRYEDAKDEWEWVNGIDSRNLEARKGLALVKQKLEIQQSIVLATGYLAEGLYRKSVDEWSKVLNVEPDNARALKYLKKAEKLLVIEQKDNEAAAAYKNRKYRKASKIWSLLLEENPSHSERHKWVQFISEIEEKRKAIDPASIASLHLEALTFFDDKEYGKAIAKWEEILSLDVEDEQAQRKIQEARVRIELAMEIEALTVKARTLDKEGKYESSVEEWERIIEKDPLNKQALIGIRDAEEKLAKQRREASLIADAQTLFNEEKFNEAITKWKMILFADKDNKRAKEGIKIAERVLQIKRMNARGDRFFDEKEYQDAIEMWQQVLDIDAQNEHAIKKLAEFEKVYKIDTLTVSAKELLEEGEYEKAIDEWNKILEIEPDNKDAKEEIKAALTQIKAGRLHVIASGFYTDKDYPGALRTLKEILVIDPANIQAARSIEEIEELLKNQEITRLFNRVNDLDQEGKFAEATTVLKRILEIDPVNFDAKQQMERIKAKQTVLIQKQQTVKTLFSKAEELQKNGWYEDAIGQWRLVLELEPENKDALQSIHKTEKKLEVIASALVKASDYLKQGEYKNAIGEWREVLKLDDLNQKALEGIEDASTRLKLYERIAGLHSRAETFFKGKNYRSALDEWEKILTLDPANGKALAGSKEAQRLFEIEQLNKKAGGYFSQKQYSKAREEWEKVFGFDPANLSAKKGLEEVQRIEKEIEILRADAARFMKEGKYKEAIDQWRLVLGEEPDNQEALQNLPDAEKGYSISTYISNASDYLKGGKYQLAIEEWEKVLDLDDKKRQAREGIERASKQLQLNEKIVGLNTRADTFSKDKNYQEAIALWNKVLTLDPANGKALTGSKGAQKLLEIKQLNEKAEGNFSHKHYSKAREEWQKVLVFDPANLSAKKGLEEVQRIEKRIGVLREEAVRFMKEGRYKEAIDKWRLVLGVDPDNQEALQNIPETEKKLTIITSSLSKGSNYFKQKEYQNAIKEWEKVLDLDSQNLQAGEGIEKASRQLKIKMQVEGLLSSADSAFESERYQFAITEWNKVLTLDPENVKALAGSKDVQRLMDIGKLHEKAGGYLSQKQYSKAREEWQKVLEEDPANLKAKRGIEETQRIEKEIGELSADAARLMKEERYSDAIDQWRQVLEKDPDNHVALRYIPEAEKRQAINNHLSRASDYLKREDFQHAIKEWEKVLDVDSQNRQARKGIEESNNQWYLKLQVDGLLARAENAFNDKDYQTAIARWNKVLILDPENVKALAGSKDAQKLFEIEKFNTKAGEYFSQKQYHEAIAEWQKTLEVEPANLKAIKGIEEAQKIEKEILALRADAEKLAIQEKHEEAGVKWHELLVLLPGDKKAIKGLEDAKKHGRIKMLNLQSIEFLESGKFKAAIEKCEEILQLESGNVRAKEGIRKARSGIEKRRKIGLFYDSGTKLFASGKYSEAIAEWQKILVWEPDNPKAKEGIQNARDAESRLRKKRRAITSFHTDAEKAVKAGDFLIAISHWDKLLELEPDNQNALKGIESAKKRLELVKQIDALHAKADNFFKQGKYQDALSQWKLVMVLDSHDEKALEGIRKAEVERMGALNILASDRYKEGEFEKAIELWAKVLELNPRDQKAEADIQKARNAIIQAAEIEKLNTKAAELLAQKRFREAMVHWKRVLELDPENKTGIAGIKSAQTQKARHIRELKASSLKLFEENRFEDSIKGWQEILSIAPDDPVALSQLNKTQAAHEKHRRSEENRSVVKHLLVKADEYFNRQRYTIPPKDNAFNIYKEVLKLDTENEKAKNGIIRIGQEYKKRGDKAFKEHDYSRAKGFYERILLVQSESKEGKELLEKAEKALNKQKQIDAWNAQATGLFQSGKLTTAQEIWQKVLAEDPVNDEANRGLVLINDKWLDKSLGKATQYFKDGKYEDAILTWKEILVRDSKNRDSQEGIIVAEQIKGLRSQAISLFTSGNFQKSLEKWKNILDLNPGNSEALSGVKKASAKIAIPTDIVKAMRGGDASNAFDWMDKGGDVNAKSTGGMTLLMVAAWNGHTDIIHSLISKGADVNAKNGKGETALMLSSLYGLENVVKSLLDNNAEVNAKNVSGDTALLRATLAGYGDIVKLLMERGANLNTKNKNGDNALIVAAKMGHTDTVSVLLGGGVSVNAQNAHGNTALIVAAEKGRTDTVEELLKGGAAPDYVNGRGESALSIATKKNHRKIIKLLKRTGAKR